MKKNNFSRLGFILAAARNTVGLANIWKFTYLEEIFFRSLLNELGIVKFK